MIAEPQNQQEDSRGWVLPEMGCKAHFLSFRDGLIPSPGRAAGCRSNGTLSSHHWAFALPKPAFIKSDDKSPGCGKQQPCDSVALQEAVPVPHTPEHYGAVVTVPCPRAIGFHGVGLCCHTAAQHCTSPVKMSLQPLCLPSRVGVALGCAVLDQWEKASTVLR